MYDPNNDDSGSNGYSVNKIFKPCVTIAVPDSKKESSWVLLAGHEYTFPLPPRGEDANPLDYVPYRNPNLSFTGWVTGYTAYLRFGPEKNLDLISPKTFSKDAFDPMGHLYNTVRNMPDHCYLAGLGEDGKKDQSDPDAFKRAVIVSPGDKRVVNAFALEGEQKGQNRILTLSSTAIGSTRNGAGWGLIGQLQQEVPAKYRSPIGDPPDWTNQFAFGDPTDPAQALGVRIFKSKPATGGLEQYNAAIIVDPKDGAAYTYEVTEDQLRNRWYLGDIFERPEPAEQLEMIIGLFSGYPALLRKAFAARRPGLESELEKLGLVNNPSTVRQVGGYRDEDPDSMANRAAAAPIRKVSQSAPAPANEDRTYTDRPLASGTSATPAPASKFTPRPAPGAATPTATAAPASPAQPIKKPGVFTPRPVPATTPAVTTAAAPAAGDATITVSATPRNEEQMSEEARSIMDRLAAEG